MLIRHAQLPGSLAPAASRALIFAAYALLGAWGAERLERINRRLLRLALGFGLAAAGIYAAEIVLEYLLLPRDNTQYGLVEFGPVFLCYLTAVSSRRSRRAGRATG
ncbi:MAG: hypothetical protein ACLP59_07335 [Bryobacteraceae bacterium]